MDDIFNKTQSGIEYCILKGRAPHMSLNKICRFYNIWIAEDKNILTDEQIHEFINNAISEYTKTRELK